LHEEIPPERKKKYVVEWCDVTAEYSHFTFNHNDTSSIAVLAIITLPTFTLILSPRKKMTRQAEVMAIMIGIIIATLVVFYNFSSII